MKTAARANLVPEDMLGAIEAAAAEEHRSPRELVSEAIAQYLSERHLFVRDEAHRKIAQGLESLAQDKGLDGEAVMAELLAEIDDTGTAR